MPETDLGPQPEPVIEPGEPNPGGVDAVEKAGAEPLPADLDPDENPAVDDVLPDQIASPDEEKQQAPEGEADDQEAGTEREPEAGQQDEKGHPEPPA